MKKWNFRKSKKFILKNCSLYDWAGDEEEPVLKTTINKTIKIAHKIQKHFHERGIELERPYFNQCGDGSIDLHWSSFQVGYCILYNYHPDGASLYGDNMCRNWWNRVGVEIKTFNNRESRKILMLFAKWCSIQDISWEIEIKGVKY